MISLDEFRAAALKIATVLEAKPHPDADRLLVLTIDVGGTQKQIVAGIARHYTPAELVSKQIVVVDNLEPATLRGVTSSGMLLAAKEGDKLSLLIPDRPVAPGSSVA